MDSCDPLSTSALSPSTTEAHCALQVAWCLRSQHQAQILPRDRGGRRHRGRDGEPQRGSLKRFHFLLTLQRFKNRLRINAEPNRGDNQGADRETRKDGD